MFTLWNPVWPTFATIHLANPVVFQKVRNQLNHPVIETKGCRHTLQPSRCSEEREGDCKSSRRSAYVCAFFTCYNYNSGAGKMLVWRRRRPSYAQSLRLLEVLCPVFTDFRKEKDLFWNRDDLVGFELLKIQIRNYANPYSSFFDQFTTIYWSI